jgi:hypothetical protein
MNSSLLKSTCQGEERRKDQVDALLKVQEGVSETKAGNGCHFLLTLLIQKVI